MEKKMSYEQSIDEVMRENERRYGSFSIPDMIKFETYNGRSLKSIARDIGTRRDTIEKMASGKLEKYSASQIRKIAGYFGVGEEYIKNKVKQEGKYIYNSGDSSRHKEYIPAGKRMRKAREAKKLTVRELSDMLGYGFSSGTISRIEQGTSEMDDERAKKIADVLDVDPNWLKYGDESGDLLINEKKKDGNSDDDYRTKAVGEKNNIEQLTTVADTVLESLRFQKYTLEKYLPFISMIYMNRLLLETCKKLICEILEIDDISPTELDTLTEPYIAEAMEKLGYEYTDYGYIVKKEKPNFHTNTDAETIVENNE